MLSKEQKLEYLEQVAQSKTFKNSPSSTALLRYLGKESIKETNLKEGVIEAEFYGTIDHSEKSNPRVRVNVYHLRKKLNAYYEEEGKNDSCKLSIDKGQYNVRFESTVIKKAKSKGIYRYLPYTIALVLALVILIQNIPDQKPNLWKGFLNNGLDNTLYIGDALGMIGKEAEGKPYWVKYFHLNSIEENYEFIKENSHPKQTLQLANYSYINGGGAVASRNLAMLFSKFNKEFDIQEASKAQFSDIKDENLIYVGSPLVKRFIELFNDANPYCTYEKSKFILKGHPLLKDTILNIHSSGLASYEYAIVSKVQGPQKTEQFFFFSIHEIGNRATFEYFTTPDSIKAFSKKHLKDKNDFTALYKVYGKERVDLGFEEVMVVPF